MLASIAGQYTPGFFGGELQMGAQHRDRKCSGTGQGEECEKSAAVSVNVYEQVTEIEIFSEGGGGKTPNELAKNFASTPYTILSRLGKAVVLPCYERHNFFKTTKL